MENVQKPHLRAWIDTKYVKVKDFKEKWAKSAMFKINDVYSDLALFNSLLCEEEYEEIENQCGLESMKCDFQERVELTDYIVDSEDVKLQTLHSRAEELEVMKGSRYYSLGAHYQVRRYRDYPIHKIIGTLKNADDIPFKPIVRPDVLLTVQLYVPEVKLDAKTALAPQKAPCFQIDFEFLVLGDQFLTDLRDKIECVSDMAIPGELSECPDLKHTVTCKDLYKSGFFYINGTFYNDMRDKNCRDYSEVILKWATKCKRGIGPFKKASMEKTKFVDLEFKMGYPYVYVHQGNCEHLLVFSDMRMFSDKHDEENRNCYPLYSIVRPAKRIFCMVCHLYASVWVVYGSSRLPYTTFFFCNACYRSFNYDKNGQKIGNFSSYYFPDCTKLA